MWTLWIISSIIDSTEPKYTRYAEYDSKMSCHIEWHLVTMDFTENEIAYCEGPND
jgi:hypothetical protein